MCQANRFDPRLNPEPMSSLESKVISWISSSAASFGESAAEPASPTPFAGAWAVDVNRPPMPPEALPKSFKITASLPNAERVQMGVEVIDPSGARFGAEGVTVLDGLQTQVESDTETDVSGTQMPRPDFLIMQHGKNGIPAMTRIYAVDPSGKTM